MPTFDLPTSDDAINRYREAQEIDAEGGFYDPDPEELDRLMSMHIGGYEAMSDEQTDAILREWEDKWTAEPYPIHGNRWRRV